MDELLAKPDVTLLEHSRRTCEIGNQLASKLGLSTGLGRRALLACAFHDVGKATLDFQEQVRGKKNSAYPHALAALPLVLTLEAEIEGPPFLATGAVLSHHSPLSPDLYTGWEKTEYHSLLKDLLQAIAAIIPQSDSVAKSILDKALTLARESPSSLLHDDSFRFGKQPRCLLDMIHEMEADDFAKVEAVLHIADWMASSDKTEIQELFLAQGSQGISRHFVEGGYVKRGFQRQIEGAGDKVYLRAPTGSGKTEALLLWAGNAERVIYLLPTQASVNAMWQRLKAIYGSDNVGISHGRSAYLLRKVNESEEPPLDLKLFSSVFAKPVVVATLDQYLMAHLHGRHWEERLSLSEKASVIIDEVHSYEPYTLGLLVRSLEKSPPSKLAIASATLPSGLTQTIGPSEEVMAEPSLWENRRHRVSLIDGDITENLLQMEDSAATGKQTLIIANTVRRAQDIYQSLKSRYPHVELLHSRFTFRDRQEKERRAQERLPGRILVATQVVEVSLDISYDEMFTEIAPIDALVQRMGRVNRYGEIEHAPVNIYTHWDEGSEKIYGKGVLDRSAELIKDIPSEPSDWELCELTEAYSAIIESEEFARELQKGKETIDYVQNTLGTYTIDLEDEELRSRFTTRKGQISIDVIPQQYYSEAMEMLERKERWKIVELLVPVPISWLHIWWEYFGFDKTLSHFITCLPYNSEFGLRPANLGSGENNVEII